MFDTLVALKSALKRARQRLQGGENSFVCITVNSHVATAMGDRPAAYDEARIELDRLGFFAAVQDWLRSRYLESHPEAEDDWEFVATDCVTEVDLVDHTAPVRAIRIELIDAMLAKFFPEAA